ncbi:hypothetical protein K1T71_002297 [Dendrolimus kikuchii]|uniref:Uncharacterized protein n=1 Tax=Dendrolimus kikuchii TaxID=765133 RepID=A0ACC1DCI3_9NEOP|nr:hypothetical protein K1T71_002297 [Dendrolimus kikuchii]
MDRCVNCSISTRFNTMARRALDDETTLAVIRQWRAPTIVKSTDHVCQACWDLAQTPIVEEPRQIGHLSVCLRCGRSLSLRVKHALHTGSLRELKIFNVIKDLIKPRTIEVDSYICHKCWVSAYRTVVKKARSNSSQKCSCRRIQGPFAPHPIEEVPKSQPEPTILLPDYRRAIETQSRCFIEGCKRTERYKAKLAIRRIVLDKYKFYIPPNNRLCTEHLDIEEWDKLSSLSTSYVQTFTAKHIQDMISLR